MFYISAVRHYYTEVFASALLISMSIAPIVRAASPDAWKEFKQKVEKACLDASKGVVKVERIQVDPYGSESYGFAVVFGTEVGSAAKRLIACAYDKTSDEAEISNPFDR